MRLGVIELPREKSVGNKSVVEKVPIFYDIPTPASVYNQYLTLFYTIHTLIYVWLYFDSSTVISDAYTYTDVLICIYCCFYNILIYQFICIYILCLYIPLPIYAANSKASSTVISVLLLGDMY